jgi:hypothetical protein
MLAIRRALREIVAGAVFVAFGLAFAIGSLAYDLGTPADMGPGYVPLVLGAVLVALGAIVIVRGMLAGEVAEPIGEMPLRAIALITAALIFFGLTVRGLGVVGSLLGTSLMATLAREGTRPLEVVAIAVGLTVISVLIFIVALQLRLPLFGTWLPL